MVFNINKDLNFGLFSVSKKIGPVSIVLDKLFRKEGPTQEEAEALAAANDAARKKRINETGNIPGWPFRNHAQELRRTRGIDKVMVIPRMKFTYVIEFRIDQDWMNSGLMITNLKDRELIRDGSIYIPVQSIDHPQVDFDVETLRSANRYVKVPKKMEYQPATVTFHDDVTSMIAALRKEYIHFYHYAGDVGQRIGTTDSANLDVEKAWDEFQYETTGLVAPLGEQNRSRMEEHPSIGLKMRSDCSKHFFKEIVIYDLGVHPDSINAYYFYHPVVTAWSHDNLDYEDRQSKVTMGMQFEYESYYDVIGQNNSKVEGILFQLFGITITPSQPSDDHAKMIDPSGADQDLSVCTAQQPSGSTTPNPPQQENCNQYGTESEIRGELDRLVSQRTPSTGPLATEKEARLQELQSNLAFVIDCNKRQTPCPPEETADAARRTAEATGATATDPAAAAGSDTTKCRQNVGITATTRDTIGSASNEAAIAQRANDRGRFQRLSNQQADANDELNTATSDLEILESMKQSGGTEGSQELSRTAYEDLTEASGGDLDTAIENAKARQESAESNLASINEEIEPLGRKLNEPLPPPEPDTEVVRAETQQRLQGRRIEVLSDLTGGLLDRKVAQRDQLILDQIEGGDTSNKKFLSAPILNDLDERGLDSARETSDQQLANSEALLQSSSDELAELDEKIKAV